MVEIDTAVILQMQQTINDLRDRLESIEQFQNFPENEKTDEQRNILRAFSQGRHLNGKDVQPIIEVLAK